MASLGPGTTLIVGAGQAGYALAAALRRLGDDRPITLVGDEAVGPYERPPLSKGYLLGSRDRDSVVLRPRDWFPEQGIDLVTGEAVSAVTPDDVGGTAVTTSGRSFRFSRLALATGSVNRQLDVPGADLDGVLSLRDLVDADRLAERLHDAHRVVVIGGGFIGLEIAAAARILGREVTVVEVADRLLGRAVSPALSDFYAAAHRRRGTRILLNTSVARLVGTADDGHRDVSSVELVGGGSLPADLVVVAVGARARTELAEQLGLQVDGGIVVDEHSRTSDGRTVAVGDCTNVPNPFVRSPTARVRLESAQHATDHALTAAATLLGRTEAYMAVPWFWSDQGDLKLQIVGLVGGQDQTVVRGDPASEHFSLLHYRDGLLLAAECVGTAQDHLAVKRGLERNLTIDPAAAGDPTVPLKRLLVTAPSGSVSD